jgi:selenocysteine lyase/cysteine desulfurase
LQGEIDRPSLTLLDCSPKPVRLDGQKRQVFLLTLFQWDKYIEEFRQTLSWLTCYGEGSASMNNQRIYMDHIAGTPVAPRVMEAMLPYVQNHFGNPASIHHGGELPQEAVFRGREQVARLVGADPEEIIFTSCGTESNH